MASNRCAGSPAQGRPVGQCRPRCAGPSVTRSLPPSRERSTRTCLKGLGDAAVLEVIARHDGDTFRAVYTVRFGEVVYVLHVFQKKSKRSITRPKKEL